MTGIIFTILIFAFIGVGIYRLDMWLVKLLSKKEKKSKGMLIGRKLLAKFITAGVAMAIMLYINPAIIGSDHNIGVFTGYLILEYASIIAGFYIARWVIAKLPGAMKKSKQYIEDVGEGRRNPVEDVKNKLEEISPLKPTTTKEEAVIVKSEEVKQPGNEATITPVETKEEPSSKEKMNDSVKRFLES